MYYIVYTYQCIKHGVLYSPLWYQCINIYVYKLYMSIIMANFSKNDMCIIL